MQTFRIPNLDIVAAGDSADRICYILSPFDATFKLVPGNRASPLQG